MPTAKSAKKFSSVSDELELAIRLISVFLTWFANSIPSFIVPICSCYIETLLNELIFYLFCN